MARSDIEMSPRPAGSANHAPPLRIMLTADQCFKEVLARFDRLTASAAMQFRACSAATIDLRQCIGG
jgi:hypothetical protein